MDEVGSGRKPPLMLDLDPPPSGARRVLSVARWPAIVVMCVAIAVLFRTWMSVLILAVFAGRWLWERDGGEDQGMWRPIRGRIELPKATPTEDPEADLVLRPESISVVRGRVNRPKKSSFTVEWASIDQVVLSGPPSAPVLELVVDGEVRARLRPSRSGAEMETRLRTVGVEPVPALSAESRARRGADVPLRRSG